ncbi:hypothetical protein Trydic_g21181 [Trypoxylus dichotomus]
MEEVRHYSAAVVRGGPAALPPQPLFRPFLSRARILQREKTEREADKNSPDCWKNIRTRIAADGLRYCGGGSGYCMRVVSQVGFSYCIR